MNFNVAVIGLGYVGLPLAVEFGHLYPTIGYDINRERIKELKAKKDSTLEVTAQELASSTYLSLTIEPSMIADYNVYVITVPTPIDSSKSPDLGPIISATNLVGRYLKVGDIVIYESTVYPGATEEVCVPILEQLSGLKFNEEFYCGYSPERVNPGDKLRKLKDIVKVTSGSTPEIASIVDDLYKSIIKAGTHKASSIRVAEAAKVIENTQRDINIALINELAHIFNRMEIDTHEVLEAAGTKWNFLPFKPGLVGGHCIGVDPYYLVHKAETLGYYPELISSARRINDNMGLFVVSEILKCMAHKKIHIVDARILIMGLTFKENCPDLRNTRVSEIYEALKSYNANVDVFDPWVLGEEAEQEFGIKVLTSPSEKIYDAIILAVSHHQFIEMGINKIRKFGKKNHIIYDIKGMLVAEDVDGRL